MRGKRLQSIRIPAPFITPHVTFSPDDRALVVGNLLKDAIQVWEVWTGKQRCQLDKERDTQVGYSDLWKFGQSGIPFDGKALASAPRSAVLAFSPNCRHLAQVTRRDNVIIWDVLAGEVVGRVPASQGTITAVAFSPDGAVLATTGADTTTVLWDVAAVCKPSAPQKGSQCP